MTVAPMEDVMRWIKLLMMIVLGVLLFNLANRIAFPELNKIEEKNQDSLSEIEVESTILFMMESYPLKVSLAIRGELPIPCRELVWEVVNKNDKKLIEVVTYAESAPERFCIQVLEPFEHTIPLGSFTELDFRVRLNGEEIGDV
jgi:hypothetical protein